MNRTQRDAIEWDMGDELECGIVLEVVVEARRAPPLVPQLPIFTTSMLSSLSGSSQRSALFLLLREGLAKSLLGVVDVVELADAIDEGFGGILGVDARAALSADVEEASVRGEEDVGRQTSQRL
jgi:hypothetical protein